MLQCRTGKRLSTLKGRSAEVFTKSSNSTLHTFGKETCLSTPGFPFFAHLWQKISRVTLFVAPLSHRIKAGTSPSLQLSRFLSFLMFLPFQSLARALTFLLCLRLQSRLLPTIPSMIFQALSAESKKPFALQPTINNLS